MSIAIVLVLIHYVGDTGQKFWIRCRSPMATNLVCSYVLILRFVVWGESYDQLEDIALGFPRPQDNVWPYLGGYIALRELSMA